MPSFTALAVLFPDYQNLTYVKQQNVALPKFKLTLYYHFKHEILIAVDIDIVIEIDININIANDIESNNDIANYIGIE